MDDVLNVVRSSDDEVMTYAGPARQGQPGYPPPRISLGTITLPSSPSGSESSSTSSIEILPPAGNAARNANRRYSAQEKGKGRMKDAPTLIKSTSPSVSKLDADDVVSDNDITEVRCDVCGELFAGGLANAMLDRHTASECNVLPHVNGVATRRSPNGETTAQQEDSLRRSRTRDSPRPSLVSPRLAPGVYHSSAPALSTVGILPDLNDGGELAIKMLHERLKFVLAQTPPPVIVPRKPTPPALVAPVPISTVPLTVPPRHDTPPGPRPNAFFGIQPCSFVQPSLPVESPPTPQEDMVHKKSSAPDLEMEAETENKEEGKQSQAQEINVDPEMRDQVDDADMALETEGHARPSPALEAAVDRLHIEEQPLLPGGLNADQEHEVQEQLADAEGGDETEEEDVDAEYDDDVDAEYDDDVDAEYDEEEDEELDGKELARVDIPPEPRTEIKDQAVGRVELQGEPQVAPSGDEVMGAPEDEDTVSPQYVAQGGEVEPRFSEAEGQEPEQEEEQESELEEELEELAEERSSPVQAAIVQQHATAESPSRSASRSPSPRGSDSDISPSPSPAFASSPRESESPRRSASPARPPLFDQNYIPLLMSTPAADLSSPRSVSEPLQEKTLSPVSSSDEEVDSKRHLLRYCSPAPLRSTSTDDVDIQQLARNSVKRRIKVDLRPHTVVEGNQKRPRSEQEDESELEEDASVESPKRRLLPLPTVRGDSSTDGDQSSSESEQSRRQSAALEEERRKRRRRRVVTSSPLSEIEADMPQSLSPAPASILPPGPLHYRSTATVLAPFTLPAGAVPKDSLSPISARDLTPARTPSPSPAPASPTPPPINSVPILNISGTLHNRSPPAPLALPLPTGFIQDERLCGRVDFYRDHVLAGVLRSKWNQEMALGTRRGISSDDNDFFSPGTKRTSLNSLRGRTLLSSPAKDSSSSMGMPRETRNSRDSGLLLLDSSQGGDETFLLPADSPTTFPSHNLPPVEESAEALREYDLDVPGKVILGGVQRPYRHEGVDPGGVGRRWEWDRL